jgi:hypothetical protein
MEMPPLLVEAFDGDDELLQWVGTLRESWQRYIAQMVMEPVSDDAKQRRAESWAERLLQTMEAEQELPPLLARRLRTTRDAAAGWERMARNRRLDYLLTIFGARSEAATETQVVRWLDACVAKGKSRRRA